MARKNPHIGSSLESWLDEEEIRDEVTAAVGTYTSKEDEAFFAAIGRLTISWAHIEAGLDCSIDVIHRCLGGKQIDADAPRTSLFRKLKYIRKWIETIPEPSFCKAVRSLMDEIEQAAEFRHDVIHGFVINQVEGTGEAEMFRLIYGAVTPSNRKTYRLTTIEILKAAVRANKIGKRSLQMATGLQDLVASVTAST